MVDELGRRNGRHPHRLPRREPRADEQRELVMNCEARHDVRVAGVGAEDEVSAGAAQVSDELLAEDVLRSRSFSNISGVQL